MVKEKHYEIVKSGGKEYVYEIRSSGNTLSDVISGPVRDLKEIHTVTEK